MKYKIGTVYSFSLKNKNDLITGQFLEENNDWILLREIPVDYVIDGFRLLNKEWIVEIFSGKEEERIRKVIDLKKTNPCEFNLKNSSKEEILRDLIKKEGLIQLEFDEEDVVYVGKVLSFIGNKIVFQMIEVDAQFAEIEYIELAQVSSIQFENDYVISLELLNKSIQGG